MPLELAAVVIGAFSGVAAGTSFLLGVWVGRLRERELQALKGPDCEPATSPADAPIGPREECANE